MTLAIMQPYLFPYIGYWQLINAVDTFVIYDDVNFIKQSYINRNYLLQNNESKIFTLELLGASSNKLINEIEIGKNRKKILKTIEQNYRKTPYFKVAFPLLKEILEYPENNLSKFIAYSLEKISEYLSIDTKIIYSSNIDKDNSLKGEDKVIHICKLLNTKSYINAIGGESLYSKDNFNSNDINLYFLNTKNIKYKQFNNKFVPYLSIIDIMMFNSKDEIKNILGQYKLI